MVNIGQFAQFKSEGRIVHKIEVLNRWRRLDLPIMPPGPVSFHAFPHKLQGLTSLNIALMVLAFPALKS